jgi:four helix bundle protein
LEKDWGMRDQIRRASVAIPSNIAEGYERGTPTEFRHFANIARGSCGEVRTQLYLCQALGYFSKEDSAKLITECVEISSMLNSLARQLQKQSTQPKSVSDKT